MSEVPRFWRQQRESIGHLALDPKTGKYGWINRYSVSRNGHSNGNGHEIYNFGSRETSQSAPDEVETVDTSVLVYDASLVAEPAK